MAYELRFSKSATGTLKELESGNPNQQAKLTKVRRALARL